MQNCISIKAFKRELENPEVKVFDASWSILQSSKHNQRQSGRKKRIGGSQF